MVKILPWCSNHNRDLNDLEIKEPSQNWSDERLMELSFSFLMELERLFWFSIGFVFQNNEKVMKFI